MKKGAGLLIEQVQILRVRTFRRRRTLEMCIN